MSNALNEESDTDSQQRPCSSYWPLWKHMADNHGLMLLDSECEEILRVADHMLMRRIEGTVSNSDQQTKG